MSGFPPNQNFSFSDNQFRQHMGQQKKQKKALDPNSPEAVEEYRQEQKDPKAQRLKMFQQVRQQRIEMLERAARDRELYELTHGAIEAGFGGPRDSGGGDVDYMA